MKKIYSAQNSLMIGHLKNLLEAYGIECEIKNTYLAVAAGEIPPIECWPELWVTDDAKETEARMFLERILAPLESIKKSWKCVNCGEEVEGQFAECWNCGNP
jgi:rubrerythrin